MLQGQNNNVVDQEEGIGLLKSILNIGRMQNMPTSVMERVMMPLCLIYNILPDHVRIKISETKEITLLDLAEIRAGEDDEEVAHRLRNTNNSNLLMSHLPVGDAPVAPLFMTSPITAPTPASAPQNAMADEKKVDSHAISWEHVKFDSTQTPLTNPRHKEYLLEILECMLFNAYFFKASFKSIFHFLATSCVQHNLFLQDDIKVRLTAGGARCSLRDIMVQRGDRVAVEILDNAYKQHPNLGFRNPPAQQAASNNSSQGFMPVSREASPNPRFSFSVSNSNSSFNPLDHKLEIRKPLFSRTPEPRKALVVSTDSIMPAPQFQFTPVTLQSRSDSAASMNSLASMTSGNSSVLATDSKASTPMSVDSASSNASPSVSPNGPINELPPLPELPAENRSSMRSHSQPTMFDSPVKSFGSDRSSLTPSKLLDFRGLTFSSPSLTELGQFSPDFESKHKVKTEEKMQEWFEMSDEKLTEVLTTFAEKARKDSGAKQNCPYNSDCAVRFFKTHKQPRYKIFVRPNQKDWLSTINYMNEIVINGRVIRVRQVVESTIEVPENGRIRELPPGDTISKTVHHQGRSEATEFRIAHERRVEYFKLEETLIKAAEADYEERLKQDPNAKGGQAFGRLDFYCVGEDPGSAHNIAFLATWSRRYPDNPHDRSMVGRVKYIDLQFIMNSEVDKGRKVIFSEIAGKHGYRFIRLDGTMRGKDDFGIYCFIIYDSETMPPPQLQNTAQQNSSSNNSSNSNGMSTAPMFRKV